jgi:hypothetical protein
VSFEFECTKKATSASGEAIQVLVEETGELLWLPLSQVEESHFHTKTGEGRCTIPDWLARKKGLLSEH